MGLRQFTRLLAVLGTVAGLSGCGESATAERPLEGRRFHDPQHSLTGVIPDGWQGLERPISGVVYPEQVVAAASYPLGLKGTPTRGCSPRAALQAMPSDGALVQVIEYTRPENVPNLPPRSHPMGYSDGTFASFECSGPSFQFSFGERDRAFQAHVWLGDDIDPEIKAQALGVIDSLEVE